MTNEASTVPLPIMLIKPFDKTFLPSPLIRKPIKGISGIKKIKFFINVEAKIQKLKIKTGTHV